MYTVELAIPKEATSPSAMSKQTGHLVHQYLYQALAAVTRKFFEQANLVELDCSRLPHLMIELSCLGTEQLHANEALTLEARLTCASAEGFSVDYHFLAETDGRVLATWRSLHIFYDYESERALLFEAMPADGVSAKVLPGAVLPLGVAARQSPTVRH
jgi:acyl-CoA thioesterase FadM